MQLTHLRENLSLPVNLNLLRLHARLSEPAGGFIPFFGYTQGNFFNYPTKIDLTLVGDTVPQLTNGLKIAVQLGTPVFVGDLGFGPIDTILLSDGATFGAGKKIFDGADGSVLQDWIQRKTYFCTYDETADSGQGAWILDRAAGNLPNELDLLYTIQLIREAQEYIQSYINLDLLENIWQWSPDYFPSDCHQWVEPPRQPLLDGWFPEVPGLAPNGQSHTVQYFDKDDIWKPFNDWQLDGISSSRPKTELGYFLPNDDTTWPKDIAIGTNVVYFMWKSGMANNAELLPSSIKQALMQMFLYQYENRGDCAGCLDAYPGIRDTLNQFIRPIVL